MPNYLENTHSKLRVDFPVPLKQYTILERRGQARREPTYGRCFSAAGDYIAGSFGYGKRKYAFTRVSDQERYQIRRNVWFDYADTQLKHFFGTEMRVLFVHGMNWFDYSDMVAKHDLAGIIRKETGISKEDAATMKERLFEEIDQITNTRKAEPFSMNEKEQLILAVMKTAKDLSERTLEIK
jgi:hypothetical protein